MDVPAGCPRVGKVYRSRQPASTRGDLAGRFRIAAAEPDARPLASAALYLPLFGSHDLWRCS